MPPSLNASEGAQRAPPRLGAEPFGTTIHRCYLDCVALDTHRVRAYLVRVRLLVVDDDPDVQRLLLRALERDGHVVAGASSVASAQESLLRQSPDVIVLDLGLPDGTGVDLCRNLRSTGHTTPILFLSARRDVGQRVAGLDAGGDDFMGKPFAVAELRARVRALARRIPFAPTFRVEIEDVVLELGSRRALRAGQEVSLTAREWAILEALAQRRGVVAPDSLLEVVWGDVSPSARGSLDVLLARIRRKLGPQIIRTLRGEGYALGSVAP